VGIWICLSKMWERCSEATPILSWGVSNGGGGPAAANVSCILNPAWLPLTLRDSCCAPPQPCLGSKGPPAAARMWGPAGSAHAPCCCRGAKPLGAFRSPCY
jgi:hypothetical protein